MPIPNRPRVPTPLRVLLVPLLLAAGLSRPGAGLAQNAAPHAPHQHGVIEIAVVLDGPSLSLSIDAPLDSLVGFEHAPRTEAEKRAAQDLLARLRATATLLTPDPAADCRPGPAEIDAGVLAPGAAASPEGHADLEATYTWTCGKPAALRGIDLAGLMRAAPRITRVSAQVATPQGQFKASLQRPATLLRWGR